MTTGGNRIYRFGEFTLDMGRQVLLRGDIEVPLNAKPFATLLFLVRNRGRAVTKEELRKQVWQSHVSNNAMEQAVSELRSVFGEDATKPQFIRTDRRLRAYIFVASVQEFNSDSEPAVSRPKRPFAPAWAMAFAGIALCAVLGVTVASRIQPATPERIVWSGQRVAALDVTGRTLWTFDLPEPARELPDDKRVGRTRLVDLDGDGNIEALAAVSYQSVESPYKIHDELLCLYAGRLLWRFDPGRIAWTIGGRRWEGPWYIADMLVLPTATGHEVWISITHDTWWPSFLVRLTAEGQPEVKFVNSGTMYALGSADDGSRKYVLAGGVNNEYRAAMLAVLQPDGLPARSPQTLGSEFACDDCPRGAPLRYFVIPKSELSNQPYNVVNVIRPNGQRTDVQAVEVPGQGVLSMYELSKSLNLELASYSTGYWNYHELLESQSKLFHSAALCPERLQPKRVRLWTARDGWSDVLVPRAPR